MIFEKGSRPPLSHGGSSSLHKQTWSPYTTQHGTQEEHGAPDFTTLPLLMFFPCYGLNYVLLKFLVQALTPKATLFGDRTSLNLSYLLICPQDGISFIGKCRCSSKKRRTHWRFLPSHAQRRSHVRTQGGGGYLQAGKVLTRNGTHEHLNSSLPAS